MAVHPAGHRVRPQRRERTGVVTRPDNTDGTCVPDAVASRLAATSGTNPAIRPRSPAAGGSPAAASHRLRRLTGCERLTGSGRRATPAGSRRRRPGRRRRAAACP
ncbi:hypothetical protein ACFPM0_08275 [Pseudonocardia sulfidoxydans]|uniref:hypothetical protein n=1 Tax=Pseudonocardia sulfidoxydans TaxID=54011 RepID=UPI00360FD2E3